MKKFDVASIVARAARSAPIPADDSWREGLELLLQGFAQSTTFRDGAAEATEQAVIAALRARFEIEAWHAAHPVAAAAPVDKPLIIVGMPRAGTTLLLNLLRFDPQRRVHWNWEGNRELPPAETAHLHDDPRIAARVREVDALIDRGILPRNHHVERGDEPTECFWPMAQDFKSMSWLVHTLVPEYFEWLVHDADMVAAYRYHRRYLRVLQSAAPGAWTLKFPSHALAIEEIIATYPDARIVYTHRDPIKPVGSTCSLIHHPLALFNTAVDTKMIGQQVNTIWAQCASRMIAAREAHPEFPFFDMHYQTFVADPIGTIRALYRFEGLELSEAVAERMRDELDRHNRSRDAAGAHRYRLEDYGLTVSEVDRLFGDYTAYFDVAMERG